MRTLPLSLYILVCCGLIAANISIYHSVLALQELTVTVVTAGKGTAALIRAPNGRSLLVDAGSDASILRALGETLPEWQHRIDAVILTSAEPKISGGLPDVLNRYRVTTLVRAGAQGSKNLESALAAASKDTRKAQIAYGTRLVIDKETVLTVVAPGVTDLSYGGGAHFRISSTTPGHMYVLQ